MCLLLLLEENEINGLKLEGAEGRVCHEWPGKRANELTSFREEG